VSNAPYSMSGPYRRDTQTPLLPMPRVNPKELGPSYRISRSETYTQQRLNQWSDELYFIVDGAPSLLILLRALFKEHTKHVTFISKSTVGGSKEKVRSF
jgi:hypothetical protein